MGRKIAVLIGSLREDAFSKKIAKALIRLAPPELSFEIVEISDLPFYNPDLDTEAALPPSWARFRKTIAGKDGVLFVTPEYNRSIPGALKNAIDVGSRPYSENAWKNKAGAVVSVSPSGIGAFGANHILRQSMVCVGVPMMAQPEVYVGAVNTLFDEEGNLPEKTNKFLGDFMKAYADWVEKLAG